MDYIAIYTIVFTVFFIYTGYWVRSRNQVEVFYCEILTALVLKVTQSAVMIVNCVFGSNILLAVALGVYFMFVTTVYLIFIDTTLGLLDRLKKNLIFKAVLLLPLNGCLVLYYFISFDTFGPFLVVAEGVVFLFIVKKTLNIIGKLYIREMLTHSISSHLQFYSIFLSLIYLYFIEDLIKICTISLFTRFQIEQSSILWKILISLDEFISSISLLTIFNKIKPVPKLIFQNQIPILQASLVNTLTPSFSNIFLIETNTLLIAVPYGNQIEYNN